MDSTTEVIARSRNTVIPGDNSLNQPLKRVFVQEKDVRDRQKLRRMIPISNERGFVSKKPSSTAEPESTVLLHERVSDPWEKYQRFFRTNQAGPGIYACFKSQTFDEAMVKEEKVPNKEWLRRIVRCSHKNIVELHEALYSDESIFLFYEVMGPSLEEISGSPLGMLKAFHMAALSKEVLEGLDYVHSRQHLSLGDLSTNNILLSIKSEKKPAESVSIKIGTVPGIGNPKSVLTQGIANIGGSMLKADRESFRDDVSSLGRIIVECLEPDTALRKGDTLEHDGWGTALRQFQVLTKTKTAAELLKVSKE